MIECSYYHVLEACVRQIEIAHHAYVCGFSKNREREINYEHFVAYIIWINHNVWECLPTMKRFICQISSVHMNIGRCVSVHHAD